MPTEKARDEVVRELQSSGNPCWKGYRQVGMKQKNGKRVPNCVPSQQTKKDTTPRERYQQRRADRFNANQPRDAQGRFASTGGTSVILAGPKAMGSYQATRQRYQKRKWEDLSPKEKRIHAALGVALAATYIYAASSSVDAARESSKRVEETRRAWEESKQRWGREWGDWNGAAQASDEDNLKSAYSTLGVDPDASADEVKKAYRQAARKYHPDISTDPDAEEMMKQVNNAWDEIGSNVKSKHRRDIIDELRQDRFNPGQHRGKDGRWAVKGGGARGARGNINSAALATAGVGAIAAATALYVGTQTVKSDLKNSQVDFDSIRQPPGGKPDKKTLEKYDSFEPGSLIRKNFKSDRLGTRQHYAVYMGKDPKTGDHMLIDTGEDWKARDSSPFVRKRGLTWDAGPNDSEYEVVPESEMGLRKDARKITPDEVLERADKMLYSRFTYQGFDSNCEAFARAMVEGKGYSAQGDKVSGLTRGISSFVTDNMLKVRAKNDWYPGAKDEKTRIKVGGYNITGISEYGANADKRMSAQEMADFLDFDANKPAQSMPLPWLNNGPRAAARLAKYMEQENLRDARRKSWDYLANPYDPSPKAQPQLPPARQRTDAAEESTRIDLGEEIKLCLSSVASKGKDIKFAQLGIEAPSVYAKKVEAIAGTVKSPAMADRLRVRLLKNYFMLFSLSLRANAIAGGAQ